MAAINFEWKDAEATELDDAWDGTDPWALGCVSFRQMLPLPAAEGRRAFRTLPEGSRRKPQPLQAAGSSASMPGTHAGSKKARTR
jgi:hypothetical protein